MTLPPKPAVRIFRPSKSFGRFDLLAEPAEHLAAGLAGRESDDVEAVIDLVHQLAAIAEHHPGIVLARREAEGQRAVEDEARVLADVVAGIGVAAFDGAVGHRVEHLQGGHDLAGGEGLELELAVGQLADDAGDGLRRAEERVEALGEARGEAPLHVLARLLGEGGRCGKRGQRRGGGELSAGDGHDVSSSSLPEILGRQ